MEMQVSEERSTSRMERMKGFRVLWKVVVVVVVVLD